MDMTIFKYPFAIKDEFKLDLPIQAEILAVDTQFDTPCIWAKVNADAPTEEVTFQIRGTGHPMRDGCDQHIGTFQMRDGALIWHVFRTVIAGEAKALHFSTAQLKDKGGD